MCWYCHNRDLSMHPHWYWDACPLFQYHVSMGTVHLNSEGRIALGCAGEGGAEVSFWANQGSQSEQIMKKVTGMRYDPMLSNRPVEGQPRLDGGRSTTLVGFIIVDSFEDDSDVEEHEFPEGYGQVSIVSVADVD